MSDLFRVEVAPSLEGGLGAPISYRCGADGPGWESVD